MTDDVMLDALDNKANAAFAGRIVRKDLAALEHDMDKLGVPWTPGRPIPQGN